MHLTPRISYALITLAITQVQAADTIDSGNNGSQYAWSESSGWLNAEPEGDGGSGMQVKLMAVDGWLWFESIGWVSLSCVNTGSCQITNYGVGHDGSGILSGYAWSENAGWISFSCQNTASCGSEDFGVTFNPLDGNFGGYAWSENLGWISFACENTSSCGSVDFGVRTGLGLLSQTIFQDGFESP